VVSRQVSNQLRCSAHASREKFLVEDVFFAIKSGCRTSSHA
jgi:hypothetical protein